GDGLSWAVICWAMAVICSMCASARKSPEAALLTNCFKAASNLVIVFRLPFSLITTFSRNVFINTVAILRLPLGRPCGLPDCPGWKRDFAGGLRYPSGPLLSLILFLLDLSEGQH